MGANIFGFPVVLRRFAARRARRIGPYVSGSQNRGIQDTPATMSPIQNDHRQPSEGAVNPDIAGAMIGPIQVPY